MRRREWGILRGSAWSLGVSATISPIHNYELKSAEIGLSSHPIPVIFEDSVSYKRRSAAKELPLRHCERSDAIQCSTAPTLDCRASLAMMKLQAGMLYYTSPLITTKLRAFASSREPIKSSKNQAKLCQLHKVHLKPNLWFQTNYSREDAEARRGILRGSAWS